jgi:clathrin heavy chain
LAQICGLNLIVHAEELVAVIKLYEKDGYFDELVQMLESGIGLERAHMGIFTELAISYSKYKPEKLMEYLKMFYSRVNIPKVIRACETAHMWSELIFLYVNYDEFDNAVLSMMKYSSDTFDHDYFKSIVGKVANTELLYKALRFYLEEQPLLVADLLLAVASRIDHARVVQMFEKSKSIPLIKNYLVSVQNVNNVAVNNAYNNELIEEGDYKTLRISIDQYENFDSMALAQRLEKHDLLEFRRIAAYLFKKSKKYKQSVQLSKKDLLFKDAMETAAESKDHETAEELLEYFISHSHKEYFAACLYICYDLLRPDVVLELAWRHQLNDFAMPYLIQMMREYMTKIDVLEKNDVGRAQKEEELEKKALGKKIDQNFNLDQPIITGGMRAPLMLTAGPTSMPNAPGPNMGYMGGGYNMPQMGSQQFNVPPGW